MSAVAPRTPSRALPSPPALRPGEALAWFFDVDGTVAEIADTPDAARVDPAIASLIAALHRASDGALALVSGRPIAEVDALFPGTRYAVAGQHGIERRRPDGRVVRAADRVLPLDDARRFLEEIVSRHAGLRLEVKPASLALHYRQAPRLAGFVHRTMRTLQRGLGDAYRLQPGKRVLELLPRGPDKGEAVRAFLAEAPFEGRTPIFVGDDLTDERAFAIVNARDGYSIKVGPGPTIARWRLPGVGAVRTWLQGDDR